MTALFTSCGRGVVAVLAAATTVTTVATACSTSTAGSGSRASGPPAVSGSAPVSGGNGSTGAGGGGAVSGNFCHDWGNGGPQLNPQNLQNVGHAFLAHWDALAGEAPDPIKSDVTTIDQYLHSILAGKVDPSMATQVGAAVRNVVVWVGQNCH